MEEQKWETAVNQLLVRRLQQRQFRPGVWDQQVSTRIIRRHTRIGPDSTLAERLLRRWQPLDDGSAGQVPIVYAMPTASIAEQPITNNSSTNTTIINKSSQQLSTTTAVSPPQHPPQTSKTAAQANTPSTKTNQLILQQRESTHDEKATESHADYHTSERTVVTSETAVSPPATPPKTLKLSTATTEPPTSESRQAEETTGKPNQSKTAQTKTETAVSPATPIVQPAFAAKNATTVQPLTLSQPSKAEAQAAQPTTAEPKHHSAPSPASVPSAAPTMIQKATRVTQTLARTTTEALPLAQPAAGGQQVSEAASQGRNQAVKRSEVDLPTSTETNPKHSAAKSFSTATPLPLVHLATNETTKTAKRQPASPTMPLVQSAPVQANKTAVLPTAPALPLAKPAQPTFNGTQTAVVTPKAHPQKAAISQPQPPSWMQKQAAKPRETAVNLDNLVNKVEQQLLQRLTVQRERRGRR